LRHPEGIGRQKASRADRSPLDAPPLSQLCSRQVRSARPRGPISSLIRWSASVVGCGSRIRGYPASMDFVGIESHGRGVKDAASS